MSMGHSGGYRTGQSHEKEDEGRLNQETKSREAKGAKGKKKGFRKRKGDRWLQKEKSDGIRTEKRLRRGASYWSLHRGYR